MTVTTHSSVINMAIASLYSGRWQPVDNRRTNWRVRPEPSCRAAAPICCASYCTWTFKWIIQSVCWRRTRHAVFYASELSHCSMNHNEWNNWTFANIFSSNPKKQFELFTRAIQFDVFNEKLTESKKQLTRAYLEVDLRRKISQDLQVKLDKAKENFSRYESVDILKVSILIDIQYYYAIDGSFRLNCRKRSQNWSAKPVGWTL